MIQELRKELKKLASPKKAKIYQRFFKTGIGEYGEGDVFLGLSVPQSRKIAIKYKDLPFSDIKILLKSKIHEERLIAVLILVYNFSKRDEKENPPSLKLRRAKRRIFDFYLAHTKYINNWDLVDLSADKIVGQYLLELESRHSGKRSRAKSRESASRISPSPAPSPLEGEGADEGARLLERGGKGEGASQNDILVRLAKSENLWERRIAIISTFQFIKKRKEYDLTFKIAEILLADKHDLIHKAVGWMLREVGKQCSQEILEEFLKKHYKQMPRTTLRYAIERFPENLRKEYLL